MACPACECHLNDWVVLISGKAVVLILLSVCLHVSGCLFCRWGTDTSFFEWIVLTAHR